MKVEQVLELVKAVSESELTEFKYEEDGVKLSLKKTSDRSFRLQRLHRPRWPRRQLCRQRPYRFRWLRRQKHRLRQQRRKKRMFRQETL